MPTELSRLLAMPLKKKGSDEVVVRLFTMNKRQAQLRYSVIRSLIRDGMPKVRAEQEVGKLIFRMLQGLMPKESDIAVFHEMRVTFPVLKKDHFDLLPIAGAPEGRITSVCLLVTEKDAVAATQYHVRIDFSDDQADAYNLALDRVTEINECSRDESWLLLGQIIGALLAGEELKMKGDTECVEPLRSLFFPLSRMAFKALPRSTDKDIRRWGFRDA